MKGEGVGVRSLARSTSRVEGHVGALKWIRMNDKRPNYSHEHAQNK